YTMGIRRILIPRDNMRDMDELDKIGVSEETFVPCDTLDDVLKEALVREETADDIREVPAVREEIIADVIPNQPNDRVYGTV
ncbi:MAG: hypothetical protein IJV76_09340, partial [Clostridia bacterium]|nr:hypothetical protein [Clostridia bacterium]